MHDVRWVLGDTIETTVPQLKSEWIGNAQGLHIDSYKQLRFVDGYRITIVNTNETDGNEDNKIWFINLGGYISGERQKKDNVEVEKANAQKIKK